MPSLTLVTGGPRSGKTERLLQVAAERYRADPFASCLVLVPTARHADQFRRRLVERTGVAFGLDVAVLNLFARRHVPAEDIAPPDVARELLERVIDERIKAGGLASRFAPIAGTPGLAALVRGALRELLAEAVPSDVFARAASTTGDPDLRALAEVLEAYRDALAARGWAAPEEIAALAASRIAGAEVPPLVLVDGAQFFGTGETALIAALAARTEVLVTLDEEAGARARWSVEALRAAVPDLHEEHRTGDDAPAPDASASTAADDEAQLREIARSIKARLTEDRTLRPSDFAVAFRRVTPHLPAARRVFAEAELPLDPAAGERLASRPFGAWLLGFLRAGVHGWRVEDVVHSLESGFCAAPRRWDLRGRDLERLLRIARGQRLWAGLERLRALRGAVESDVATRSEDEAREYREAAERWLVALDDLEAALEPAAERTPAAHARLLDDFLFGPGGCVRVEAEGYPSLDEEASALRRELLSFRAVEDVLGSTSVTFEVFVRALEARMQRPVTILREAGGVLLAPMHTLHGLRFEHVYVAGLVEGEFPAPPRAVVLLDRTRRAALAGAGLALPPEARAGEDELWQVVTTRAQRSLSLWRPRLAGKRPAAASYYFDASGLVATDVDTRVPAERAASVRELAISLAGRWPSERRRPAEFPAWDHVVRWAPPVEQRRRSLAVAGEYEGIVPGIDLGWLVASDRGWSPSRLESHLTCSFQFFGAYALGLSEISEEATRADAATRGTVMHEILDAVVAPLIERGEALNSSTLDEAARRLRERGPAIWDSAPERHSFGRAALWRYEGRRALEELGRLLEREAALGDAFGLDRVEGVEAEFEAALDGIDPPMIVRGRADRVDSGPGLVQIVDYKTGKAIERKKLVDGRRLQLQLYALAARERWGDVRLIARYAFLRPKVDDWWLDSDREEDRAILEGAARIAAGIREEVASGAFAVTPKDGDCPMYCAFKHMCRVNQFSRYKTWDPAP